MSGSSNPGGERDEALRARLRAVDPAASLAPADRDRVRELLEATMSDDRDPAHGPAGRGDPEGPDTGQPWWRGRTALVAAAAVVALGGVAGGLALTGDEPGATEAVEPPASPSPAEEPAAPDGAGGETAGETASETPGETALSLTASAPPPSVRCRMVTVEALGQMDAAFAGTVTSVGDEAVTFDVDRWYAGGSVDRVEILNPPGLGAALEGAPELEPGQRYLVTAASGQVTGCGFSAPWSARLAGQFERAFS